MGDYIGRRLADDVIVSSSNKSYTEPGCEIINIKTESISGDALPVSSSDMIGGSITALREYTAPAAGIDWTSRALAWEAAMTDYYDDGELEPAGISLGLELKIKNADKLSLTEVEWAELDAAF